MRRDPAEVPDFFISHASEDKETVPLTRTQVAIIELIADGWIDKEIAHTLGMSYRTVRTHLERLYELNGVHCRAALVALLERRSYLSGTHEKETALMATRTADSPKDLSVLVESRWRA